MVKGIAARLGIRLVPVAVDDRGMRPDALRATGSLAAVYLQTTLHNPLGITMDDDRRHALADVLAERDLIALEDQVNGYLDESQPPLAGVAPERTVLVDSLSKRLSAGLSVGFAVAPVPWTDRVAAAVRSGGWTPSGFALAAAAQWVEDGTAEQVQRAKRADAAERRRLVAEAAGRVHSAREPGGVPLLVGAAAVLATGHVRGRGGPARDRAQPGGRVRGRTRGRA